jgi:hypothetical protein
MQRHLTFLRPAAALVTALGASVAIAACGGSSSSGAKSASTANTGVQFATCVRAHGVPDYPDPRARKITVDTHTLSESSRVVDAALAKCQKFQGSSPTADLPRLSDAQLTKVQRGAVAYSKCIRAHGFPDFPDEEVTRGPGGRGFAVGNTMKQLTQMRAAHTGYYSKAFPAAARPCGKVFASYYPPALRKKR